MTRLLAIALALIATTSQASDCCTVPGLDALLRPGAVLLLGEIHGTKQGPSAVSDVVCAALETGLSVTVALEIPQSEKTRIAQFLESNGTAWDRAQVLAGDFWQRDYQDGRGSQAMFELLEAIRMLRAEHKRLDALVIDNPLAPQGRDRFMAQWMKLAVADAPERFYVALTGNVHSRLLATDEDSAPLGYHLRQLVPDTAIHALRLTHDGGTAWVCTPDGCGIVRLRGESAPAPGVELFDHLSEDGFSGHFHLGAIEASAPAREQ